MANTSTALRRISVLLSCALLLLLAGSVSAQKAATPAPPQATSALTVRIVGLRNANGKIRLFLTRDSKPVESRLVDIDAQTLTANTVFDKLPQGVYSVTVYQDENMNGKMDTNFVGMPVEGYGASNNPAKRMGPPDPAETNFLLNQPESTIEITLIYW
jgi:uncharacterized protein (DUF2141 family)